MRLRAMCVVLGAVVLLGCPLRGAQADDDFVGRWDLSIGRGKSPSWLAVSRAGGELLGRFVAGGGGVHKVSSIEVSDGKLVFTRGKTRYEAALVAGKLQGKISQGGEPGPAFVGLRFEPKLDLTGTWKLVDSADYKYDLKLKHRGETLSGTCETARGVSAELYDVSLKDGKLGFSLTATKDGKQLAHRLEAEVSGDRIQGMARVEGRKNTKTFTGQRQRKWGKPTELFNGKDLTGWTYYLVEPDVKMTDVWSVRDGLLICKGEPMGYIATKGKYTNFRLIVEWRWAPGKEAGNSGVLMRITGEPRALPKCTEAQLQSGKAGDIYGFHGFQVKGDAARFRTGENEMIGKLTGVSKIKGNENEPGQWNKYDITLKDGSLTLLINGEKVNEATGLDIVPGTIGLQSEGGEIHFRTVKIMPMD